MKIVLGSASAGRKKILRKIGYDFDVMPADIDEKAIRHGDPKQLTLLLARAKANALLPRIQEPAILITSDQVGLCDGIILEKPESENEAKEFLKKYARHSAKTITAVVVTNTENGKRAEGVDIAEVFFLPIPEEVIEQYIKEGDALLQSGGFSTDHPILAKYVARIEGEPESVIGLPVALTKKLIESVL
jgi:septum formation protein